MVLKLGCVCMRLESECKCERAIEVKDEHSTSISKSMSNSMGSNSRAASASNSNSLHLWSEIVAADQENEIQHHQPPIDVVYRRRKPRISNFNHPNLRCSDPTRPSQNRLSLADPNKRVSWNRSLSTRGRTSIAVGACMVYQPQLKNDKRRAKPAIPKGKLVQKPNFEKEKMYFQEVDAFELMEESPSPKKVGTWIIGNVTDDDPLPSPCSRLQKWLHARKLNPICGPSSTLSKILDTPAIGSGTLNGVGFGSTTFRLLDSAELKNSQMNSMETGSNRVFIDGSLSEGGGILQMDDEIMLVPSDGKCEHIEDAVKKLSLASTSSSVDGSHLSPFATLLAICGQSALSLLRDVLSSYSETVVKIGEGTYGEAFKVGNHVCKIVPFDGDLRVNGEVQKRSDELVEEVLLSKTLNQLRANDGKSFNLCRTFIESKEFKVCQGAYDPSLIRAWEDWDDKHGSENDHPKEFPEKQCYAVFVQEHGGKDLESFVLMNFDEARTLLVQVTAGLAVAESAYEFEHRDLHWGNILVSRSDSVTLQFTLDGRNMFVKTYGLLISIIDFTLSRINTGERILYLDLSADPDLFKGPRGDKQSETYRRMRDVTDDWWEGSFPRTNVLWLLYLVDIILLKKSFERTSKDERELRSLKKRLEKYNSAKEAIGDPFFSELFVEQCE